jgi:hypothetical protein
MAGDDWGYWECPTCLDEQKIWDPDHIRVTTCGNGHVVLLGPVGPKHLYRWAEPYEPDEWDIKAAVLQETAKSLRDGRA